MKRASAAFPLAMGALFFVAPYVYGQQPEWRMEKVLELGKGKLLFSSIVSVDEDDDGNIFVLDRTAFKVHKFSPQGELLLSFGSQGQGPGEFQAPHRISILNNDILAVNEDLGFVSLFDTDGNFSRRLTAERGLALIYINENLFYGWLWTEQGRTQHFLDQEGHILRTFHSVPRDTFSVSAPDDSGRQVMFNYGSPEIAPSLIFNRSRKHMVVAIGDSYRFSVMDIDGRVVSTIEREIKPQKLRAKEREILLDQIEERRGWPVRVLKQIAKNLPPVKSLFDEILISPDFVFVFRTRSDLTQVEAPHPVDLFSMDGVFHGTVQMPVVPVLITSRHVYSIVYDQQDNLILQKYSYRIFR